MTQPRLPTRSEVEARFKLPAGYWSNHQIAELMVREGWATEDPEPEVDPAPNVSLIANLLRAGQIVGLDPRQMTLLALEELQRDAEASGRVQVTP